MKIISNKDYEIRIGNDVLTSFDYSSYSKIAILVDENTKKYCLNKFIDNSNINNNYIIIDIKSGEIHKNISTCNYIWEKLIENNFDKKSLLINLGGGVIGDMGGYCASSFKRGIEFIHVPTTLLGMVDASIGGKLGVNFKNLKNQIGIFNNPASVIINPEFLKTLNQKQINSGFAEILKHALISDKKEWKKLKALSIHEIKWEEIIYTSAKIKHDLIIQDPKEKNVRKKLNLGHTYGHAIESYYLDKNTPILHGQAILMGILLELEISKINVDEKNEIKEYILSNFELPFLPKRKELIKYLIQDKKNKDDKINFSLLDKIGSCCINVLIDKNEL